MARPRWLQSPPAMPGRRQQLWDRFVAVWGALSLVWVAFDLSYVPLRTFWLQRNLHPIPSVPLVVPLPFLPDVTPWLDPIKGIEPHRETSTYLRQFQALDAAMALGSGQGPTPNVTPAQRALLQRQLEATLQMIDTNPFQASGASGTLEKIKGRLRQRANLDSAKQAAARLLSPAWMANHPWSQERRFWNDQVLPLVATNYWRSIDENGRPTDHFWRIDLLLFQSVFALDVLLRAVRLRRRLPGLSWRDAFLRRWIDLPLLLPFWRWLRVAPVLERLQTSGLISIEPLRAVVSRGVVALLAVELFEVLALQLLDGLQQVIRSPRWPARIRSLRSHQTVVTHEQRELVELIRIWAPLLLVQVAPRLAPELERVLGHALQQSLQAAIVPPPLRQLQPVLAVEKGFSRQLAGGVVDSLLDLTRSTGARLGQRDDEQLALLQRFVDRFWEELAMALESGPALERSQDLLNALIEDVKRTYLRQISRAGVGVLIEELDQIIVQGGKTPESITPPPPG